MKRSKMLKKIKKVIDQWKDCEFEDRMYEEILMTVEKNGMVPSYWDENISDEFGCPGVLMYCWEEE